MRPQGTSSAPTQTYRASVKWPLRRALRAPSTGHRNTAGRRANPPDGGGSSGSSEGGGRWRGRPRAPRRRSGPRRAPRPSPTRGWSPTARSGGIAPDRKGARPNLTAGPISDVVENAPLFFPCARRRRGARSERPGRGRASAGRRAPPPPRRGRGAPLDGWLRRVIQLHGARILPVDTAVAETWVILGLPDPGPVVDGLLAATAHVHGLTLLTRNIDDVRRAGVPCLDPFHG